MLSPLVELIPQLERAGPERVKQWLKPVDPTKEASARFQELYREQLISGTAGMQGANATATASSTMARTLTNVIHDRATGTVRLFST